MTVTEITTFDQFKEIINKSTPVVIDFYATWCGPCKTISPIFAKFSESETGIEFYKLDVDAVPDAAQEVGIRAMPSFIAFKEGNKVGDVIGARPGELETLIKTNKSAV